MPSVIWYTKFEDSSKAVQATLTEIAGEYLSQVKAGSKEELIFYFSYEDDQDDEDVWDSLSKFANIEKQEEVLCLINIPSQEVYS